MQEDHSNYLKLSDSQRKKMINDAEQHQKHRAPNPQGIQQFHQLDFIQFKVIEQGNPIKLTTYRHNVPQGNQLKGIVFMFHGLNSHIGHGAHIAQYFSQNGLITVGFDHRGFGRSEGRGGYVANLESHLADSRQFLKLVMPMYENLPRFILGLSMGGLTSYHITLAEPKLFDGAILMAPAIMGNIGGIFVGITSALSKLLPQKTRLTKPILGKASRNPVIRDFVEQDKYAFAQRMSLSTVQMLLDTMESSPKTFNNYECPFMIVQGGLDKLVNPMVAFQLYEKSKTEKKDKQLVFYQEMWHDIWHEQQIYEIMQRMAVWIHKRIKIHNEKE